LNATSEKVIAEIDKASFVVYLEDELNQGLRKLLTTPRVPIIRFSSVEQPVRMPFEIVAVSVADASLEQAATEIRNFAEVELEGHDGITAFTEDHHEESTSPIKQAKILAHPWRRTW